MIIKFESLKDYMLHNPDKKVEDLAKALNISVSYLYMLIQGKRFASFNLAIRIEQILNVPASSVMKKTPFKKKKTSIFEKLKRRF